jgi:hypothetical protein
VSRNAKTRRLALLGAAALALAGCGQSSSASPPQLSSIPLARGAKVVAQNRRCDRGANSYCAVQLVIVGGRYRTSTRLLTEEQNHLASQGWTQTDGDAGDEAAADSPGHKLRLTYATASDDLKGVDLGWIKRSPRITMALSRVMFDRAPALSLMLENGSS